MSWTLPLPSQTTFLVQGLKFSTHAGCQADSATGAEGRTSSECKEQPGTKVGSYSCVHLQVAKGTSMSVSLSLVGEEEPVWHRASQEYCFPNLSLSYGVRIASFSVISHHTHQLTFMMSHMWSCPLIHRFAHTVAHSQSHIFPTMPCIPGTLSGRLFCA